MNFKGSQLNWCCTNQQRLRKHYKVGYSCQCCRCIQRKWTLDSLNDLCSVPISLDFETPACPSLFMVLDYWKPLWRMPNTRDMQYTFVSFGRRMLLGTYKWNRVAHKMIQLWDYLDFFMHCMGSVGMSTIGLMKLSLFSDMVLICLGHNGNRRRQDVALGKLW